MNELVLRIKRKLKDSRGMEMVQIAIIVGIALFIGFIFKDKIGAFVNDIFNGLKGSKFTA